MDFPEDKVMKNSDHDWHITDGGIIAVKLSDEPVPFISILTTRILKRFQENKKTVSA